VIAHLGPKLKRYRMKAEIARLKINAIQSDLERIGETLKVIVTRDSSQAEPLFALAMKFPPVVITNENLSELRPYFEHFSKVSFTSAGLVDDQLYYIGQMTNVRELYLQKNGFDGSGLIYLQDLQQLEVLNLSFSKIDDKAAIDLLKIPNLKTVYLYRTNTTHQVIEALMKNKPTLTIVMEEGPLF
ncbi:MAG TPA: hypothetical protein VK666_31180, partial [Chryseolinea sp.]|nr:hypothetical protein [Chryseolinea sp.]